MNSNWDDDWASEINDDTLCDVIENSVDHGVVLDLGCGYGRWFCALAKHYELVVGIDIQQHILRWAQNCKVSPVLSFNVHLVAADVACLPIRSGTVNAILAWGLLCEIPPGTRLSLLTEMARVLKAGGSLTLGVCNPLRPAMGAFQMVAFSSEEPSRELSLCENIVSSLKECGLDCQAISHNSMIFSIVRAKKVSTSKDQEIGGGRGAGARIEAIGISLAEAASHPRHIISSGGRTSAEGMWVTGCSPSIARSAGTNAQMSWPSTM